MSHYVEKCKFLSSDCIFYKFVTYLVKESVLTDEPNFGYLFGFEKMDWMQLWVFSFSAQFLGAHSTSKIIKDGQNPYGC